MNNNDLLRAIDVENVEFSKSLRGYNVDEIHAFLDDVIDSLHRYAERCAQLEMKVTMLENELQKDGRDVKELEKTFKETNNLVVEDDDDYVGDVNYLSEIKFQADQILEHARDERDDLARQIDELRRARGFLIADCRSLMSRFNVILDDVGSGDDPSGGPDL